MRKSCNKYPSGSHNSDDRERTRQLRVQRRQGGGKKRLEGGTNWSKDSAYKTELEFMKSATTRETAGKDPADVAKAVMHALFSETPKRRYLVVGDAYTANMTIGHAMQQMLQLNQDQAYTLNREQLIKMLDEQLKKLN
jgi:dTDP-4-amino-4,6-dideoxygalactose transaminase